MTQPDVSYVIKLENIASDNPDVGSKALALSDLIGSGFPVPPGFVLMKHAFDKFAKSNKLESKIASLVKDLDPDDFQALREASESIQALIMNSNIPDPLEREIRDAYEELSVGKEAKELGGAALDLIKAGRGEAWLAVRSSSIGEFKIHGKSVLNVRGARKLSDAVKQGWASLFSLGSMFHRRDNKVEGFPSMGLLIQRMSDSEKSGTMFTYQPETQDRSRVVIEGIPGLGQAMLDLATPDEYIIEKEAGKILDKKIRRKTWMLKRDAMSGETVRESVPRRDTETDVLSERELIKLWELALKIERHAGAREINWSMERGRINILNSRPIMELPVSMEDHTMDGTALAHGVGIYPGFVRGDAKIVLGQADLGKIKQGDLMVAMMTSDIMIPTLRKLSGLITDSGGRTCHTARLAREFGIPCIVGADSVTTMLKDDQEIGMDGLSGRIYLKEPEPVAPPEQPRMTHSETPSVHDIMHNTGIQKNVGMESYHESRIEPKDGLTATQVKVNLALPEMAERIGTSDGVGLLKAEHLLSGSGRNPIQLARNNPEEFERILYGSLEKIARTIHPKQVFYRSLDVRTDEINETLGTEYGESEYGEDDVKETNPILGWHGIRRSLDEQDVFKMEINVLRKLHQNGVNNITIMLPFVSRVEELRRAMSFLDFPIRKGIMIETPAAALDVESFCREGIDVVSIGMDDLTQLVLGIDRDNPNVSRLYTELNPAMINLIKHVIGTCKRHGVKVSVCGDVGNDTRSVEKLVELGADSISCDSEFLSSVKETVSRTERKLILDSIRK
jgi:pyruvate,water dikinase